MSQTQKVYLGSEPAFLGYLGNDPISEIQGYFNPNTIDYLVVAGGGSSGADNAGGGGAGGYIASFIEPTGSFSLTAIVGNGGQSARTNGNNSSLIGAGINEVAIGGGGGASSTNIALTGGSGGGPSRLNSTQVAGTAGQGNSGSYYESGISGAGMGGGGGAGGDGLVVPYGVEFGNKGADGGPGKQWLNGKYYAGGGGGAGYEAYDGGAGGIGGGGNGGNTFNSPTGSAGEPNTGGGGGGAFTFSEGGSGIVIIRYLGPTQKATGGDNVYYSGSYWYHEFTSVDTGSFSYTYS